MGMKTLLLIDNQDITREGMKTVAGRIGGFAAIKEAGSQSELTGLLVDNPNAVAVLDYTLFDTSAEYLLILQERFKEAHFVLFSDNLSEDFIRRMVFSGTSFSVVMKDAPMIEIEEGLRKAKQHLQYMCTRAVWLLQHKEDKKDKLVSPLTVTEREILKLMALGKTTKEIAAERFLSVYTVMTHRKNIVSLDGSMSFIDAIEFIIDTGKSRFPVYENDVDSIIGVLHIKDAFTFFEKNEVYRSSIKDIDGLIRPVDFIPETVNINDLFKKMQSKKSHLAMVVDEYGQISGLIAMEDILEELVGNIEDEHDEEENYIRKNDDETFIMDGMTEFSDVKEALSLPVEDDAYETLNGFIISLSDKIPEEGDKTVISAYGYRFSVMSVEDKVIKQVMIKKLAPEEKK